MRSRPDWNSPKPNLRTVSPVRCRMWGLHDRLGEEVNEIACATLIESIRRHGQKQPVLGRPIRDADGYEMELIYGARRFFVAQHLGVDLLVDVREIDDKEAIVEMFIENRGRQDISPYERGLSYARLLRSGVFKTQQEMAKALGVSEAQISRLLRYAELPAAVVGAFQSGCDIREEWAATLAKQCEDPATRQALLRRAREYARSGRREAPRCVYDSLISGNSRKLVKFKQRDLVVKDSTGAPAARLQFRAKTVHVVLQRSDLELSVLQRAVRTFVEALETDEDADHACDLNRSSNDSDGSEQSRRLRSSDSGARHGAPRDTVRASRASASEPFFDVAGKRSM